MDTGRTANVEDMTMDITGNVTTGIGIGTATETGIEETGTAETTGVELPVTMVDVLEILTNPDVPMTKIDAAITDATTTTVTAVAVAKTLVRLIAAVAEQGEGMALALLKEGLQRPKVLYRYLNESGRHQGGMFMPQDMSNTQPCRRSKQASFPYLSNWPSFSQSRLAGLFNLPGANRTQVPPILGIAGLPPPIPVQTFGMGIGSNPNLSRQSRRLYIGSITSDVNEQNLAEFFNSKMIEMSIGTGGPGNPVLAVQCNYEKNYAFVEVRLIPRSSITSY